MAHQHLASTILLGFAITGISPLRGAPPSGLAWKYTFNSGHRTPEIIKAATDKKIFELRETSSGGHVENYLRIEQFEGSKVTTRALQTIFTFGEATFQRAIDGSRNLSGVRLSYVILDHQGRLPVSGMSYEVLIDPADQKNTVIKEGASAKDYYQSLPPWAKTQLHVISGFLDANPGTPVVVYRPSESEKVSSAIDVVLDVMPGPTSPKLRSAIGDVILSGLKELTSKSIRNAIKTGDLRWGLDNAATVEKVLQNQAVYEKQGAKMWTF